MDDIEQLWQDYRRARCDDQRDRLLDHYAYIARKAGLAASRGRSPQDREDLIGEAQLGLLIAIRDWDPERTEDFVKFASWKARVAIVDYLRASTWLPKSVLNASRRLAQAEEELLALNLGRPPSEEEIAAHLGLSIDQLAETRSRVAGTHWRVESLDEAPSDSEVAGAWHEKIADHDQPRPEESAIDEDGHEQLHTILQRLSPVSREILERRYLRGEKSMDIARDLGVHPSRASQLETAALAEAKDLAFRRTLTV